MKLETILKIENKHRKKRLLFNLIMRSMPQSENWKVAKKEFDKLHY